MSKQDEIQKMIATRHGRNITAEDVVEAAKDADAYPQLNHYLWKESEATLAKEARLARAHRVLVVIRMPVGDGLTSRVLLHSRGVKGYRHITSITRDKDLAVSKLKELMDDIGRARGRLRAFRACIPDDLAAEIDEA